MKTLIATANTAIKQSTAQTSGDHPPKFVPFTKGQKLNILARRPVDAGHEYVTLDQTIEGFNSWFLFPGHWKIEGEEVATGHLDILMTSLNACDAYGGSLFNFHMSLNGEELDIPMGSGICGSVPTRKAQDWPGSGNPIPQGRYTIGDVRRESEWQMDPRIGPVWIPLYPLDFSGWRDGFLIHMDYNYASSPGTLGCPFPQRNRDMYTIADWVDRAESGVLTVDYGF